jgi:transcriptional regulator with PAS, ATPase and Fis domain
VSSEQPRAPLAADHGRILDALDQPVLVIARDFRIVYMNATARARYGDRDLDDEAAFCHRVLHGQERPCNETGEICPVCDVFETGKPSRAVHNHLGSSGAFAPEEVTTSPLLDDAGQVAFVVECVRGAKDLLESREVIEHMRAELDLLRGVLPTCASCQRIRTEDGRWEEMQAYVAKHSAAEFSHGLCPTCVEKLYPEFQGKKE